MFEYSDKSAAVIGMARTGLAVAGVMKNLGSKVTIYDKKSAADLGDVVEEALALGVDVRTGTDEVDLDGVDVIIPSPGVPRTLKIFADALERGIEVISEIELACRISKDPIIAITGTNGKTTTTVLVGRIMMADGRAVRIAGNVAGAGEKLGGSKEVSSADQPVPLITAAYESNGNGVIVAEVSTFQLEWIESFRPKIAAVLNVTSDHMDRHASVEEYAGLKARIFENQTGDDFSVINAENAFTASLEPGLKGRVLKFARKSDVGDGAFLRGDDVIVRIGGVETVACGRSDIRLRGEHNVENVLAAACIAVAFGVKPESIRAAVRDFSGVEHRLERVAIINGVEYINNSMCTNLDAAVRSVEAIDEPQIVISGGKAKGKDADFTLLGEAFKKKAKHVVLIGSDANVIRSAAEKAGFTAITDAVSMADAVKIASLKAVPGDVVVLTPGCASFDMFDSFEHRGQVFKEAVRNLEKEGDAG